MSTRTRIVRKHGAKSTVGASGSTTAARRTATTTTGNKRGSSAGSRIVESSEILDEKQKFSIDYLLAFNAINYPNFIFRVDSNMKNRFKNANNFRFIEITNHSTRSITMNSLLKFYDIKSSGVDGMKHFRAPLCHVYSSGSRGNAPLKRVIHPIEGLTHHLQDIAQKRAEKHRPCMFISDEEQPRVQWIARVQRYLTGTMTPHEYAATVRDLTWSGHEFEISVSSAASSWPQLVSDMIPSSLSLLHHSSVSSELSSNFTDDWDQPNRSFNSSSSSSAAAASSSSLSSASSAPSSPVYAAPSRTSSLSSVSASFKLPPQMIDASDSHLQLPLSMSESVLMEDENENEDDANSIVVKQEPIEEEQQQQVRSVLPIVKIESQLMMRQMNEEDPTETESVAAAAEEDGENAEFRAVKEEDQQLRSFDVDSLFNFDEDAADAMMKQEQEEEDPAMMKTAALLSSSSSVYNFSETPMPNLMYAMPSTGGGGGRMYRDMSSPQSLQHAYSQQSYYHTPHSPFMLSSPVYDNTLHLDA